MEISILPRDRIEQEVGGFAKNHAATLKLLTVKGESLLKASQLIRQSWSGSFIGWHGQMYFRDFSKPSVHDAFSREWGALRGMPNGWEEKSAEQVATKIDEILAEGFSVAAFEATTKSFVEALKTLKEHVDLYASALSVPPNGKAREYFNQLETLVLPNWKIDHINDSLPKSHMTRDTEALGQGTCLASWLYYEAVAIEATSAVAWFSKLTNLIQLLFQGLALGKTPELGVGNALQAYGLHPAIFAKCLLLYESGAYAEAVEKGFKTVRDKLRSLTSYETGSEAFGKGKLHIKGAAAENVDSDFNQGAKFLMMAVDMFRNEKSHTSDARIDDPARAYQYLVVSSLAMHLLDQAEIAQ